jgi:sugar (pentulose or hexulose) kinase
MTIRHVAVVDIGKTNAKLALVDVEHRLEIAALRQPNKVRTDGLYPHHDVETLWTFVLDGLAALARDHVIDAVSVTTHGATAVLLDARGELVLPVLDYEFDGPAGMRGEYDNVRSPFAETGSPLLPHGLNVGAQLFWQQHRFADAFARTAMILMYPQYWSMRLSGVIANEVTSLGCHTDLWDPHTGDFSTLVDAMGWRDLFPALKPASAALGSILPEIAARTGLAPDTPVFSGIHDSNASLLPHLLDREPPFAVVSTGTWVVSMAVGGRAVRLDAERDTLINVDALGNPVPSARFMGGREFELLLAGHSRQWSEADLADVLDAGTMLLPSTVGGSGPFPDSHACWIGEEPRDGRRFVAVSFYLALMTATCLDLIGAEGDVVVEGPFAANGAYVAMLYAATGRAVTANSGGGTGASVGAALLADNMRSAGVSATATEPSTDEMRDYAARWKVKTKTLS